MKDDTDFYPLLLDVKNALAEQVAERELPGVCFLGLEQSAAVAFDVECDGEGGCHGKAWVRLGTAYPSTAFPTPATNETKCGVPLAATIEVGIIRCVPVMDEDGTPPAEAEMQEVVRLALADMQAMKAAVCSALRVAKRAYVLGQYTALPISGAAGGGVLSATVWTQ